METSKYEKRRGRVKKQVESLKNGGLASKYLREKYVKVNSLLCIILKSENT